MHPRRRLKILPGQIVDGFSFSTPFAPTILNGHDDYFLFGCVTEFVCGFDLGNVIVPSGADVVEVPIPTPLPATWPLFMAGLGGLGLLGLRRKRKAQAVA